MKSIGTPLFSQGNRALLNVPKTVFLCSENIPDSAVFTSFDWAIAQRESGRCVIIGFESKIEKDVYQHLVKGTQPIIIALARGLQKRLDPLLFEPMTQNRLLIISLFPEDVEQVTLETIERRNRMMMEIADEIVFGFVSNNGSLEKLFLEFENKKQMMVL